MSDVHRVSRILCLTHTDVRVDGSSVSVGAECSGRVGTQVNVSVTLSNTSEARLPPLHLHITTYQDHQNGNTNHRMEGVVAAAGAPTSLLPQVIIRCHQVPLGAVRCQ